VGVARQLQEAITAARFGLESGEGPILPDLPDVRAAIRQVASPGAALAGTAFRNLALVLRVGAQLRPYVEKASCAFAHRAGAAGRGSGPAAPN
jgi:hypothetical protein